LDRVQTSFPTAGFAEGDSMVQGAACPTREALQQFLLGQTPELDAHWIERHLPGCAACLEHLQTLEQCDRLVEAVRAGGAAPRVAEDVGDPLLERLARLWNETPRAGRETPEGETSSRYCSAEPTALTTSADGQGERAQELCEFLAPSLEPGELGRLGSYRVLKVLGAGGMGVVCQAIQERPHRVVALKVFPSGLGAGRERLARFRSETEVAARLQHPNIVPIYEAGEQDGRPFFSMELLEGGSLAQKLAAVPLAPRQAAELVETLARAAEHAHERGIVHRDLKPSNILLTADGVPKIGDYGLAKQLEETREPGPAGYRTETGAVLGTPNYMAPEQATGDSRTIGPAADIHALGAILYESLTGRPPFRAATLLDTLEQVRSQEPVPPGRLHLGLPRDLQTICLKCLQKDPARRYARAAELAEDLARFLKGEPIKARPASQLERAGKWVRRKPAAAGLLSVSVTAVLAIFSGILVYNARLRTEVTRAEKGEAEARLQRERVNANYRRARAALQRMLDRANDPSRADVPNLQELRREQQEEAVAFYLSVAQEQNDHPEILTDVTEAQRHAGILQLKLGRRDAARDSFERARDSLTQLATRFPEEKLHRARLADTWNTLGSIMPSPEEAAFCHRQALAIFEELCREDADGQYQSSRAMCYHNLGAIACGRKDWAEGEYQYKTALKIYSELTVRHPENLQDLAALARNQLNLSVLLQQQKGREREAREFHDQAAATLEHLVRDHPHDYDSIEALTSLRVNWAYVLRDTGKADVALAELDKNIALLTAALRAEPNLAQLRDLLLRSYGAKANLFDFLGRQGEAATAYERVVALCNPAEAPRHRLNLALLRVAAGDYRRGVAEADAMAAQLPNQADWLLLQHIALVYAQAVPAAAKDNKLAAADRHAKSESYARLALGHLEQARTRAGEAQWQKELPEKTLLEWFEPLSQREDFRRWLKAKPSVQSVGQNPPVDHKK
jgi:serine/threonine-protein kinase